MTQATDKFYEQLQRLKKKGFRLWLDDFGSGYSSLNVFSRFDVDLIKFDMDLLRKLDDRNGVNLINSVSFTLPPRPNQKSMMRSII